MQKGRTWPQFSTANFKIILDSLTLAVTEPRDFKQTDLHQVVEISPNVLGGIQSELSAEVDRPLTSITASDINSKTLEADFSLGLWS